MSDKYNLREKSKIDYNKATSREKREQKKAPPEVKTEPCPSEETTSPPSTETEPPAPSPELYGTPLNTDTQFDFSPPKQEPLTGKDVSISHSYNS